MKKKKKIIYLLINKKDEKIAKQLEEVVKDKSIPIYGENLFYDFNNFTLLNEVLFRPDQISPVVKALEEENKILKLEVFYICFLY